jgi:hypothetical protein
MSIIIQFQLDINWLIHFVTEAVEITAIQRGVERWGG